MTITLILMLEPTTAVAVIGLVTALVQLHSATLHNKG